MSFARGWRIASGILLVVVLLGLVGVHAYQRGVDTAESRAAAEINTLRRLQEKLYEFHGINGRFPFAEIDNYEVDGLTVSDVSDTAVSYYSGVGGNRLLILHLKENGRLLTSRR